MNKSDKKEDLSSKLEEKTNKKKVEELPQSNSESKESPDIVNESNTDNKISISPQQKLKKKKEIIKSLRELVNGIEDKDTFNKVKSLQDQWKEIGHVDNSKDKSLWTTYNALLDRFYDNRSIYFELKELDRKKNLDLKTKICSQAESLTDEPNIMKSVSKLNDLHSDFKHIGPVSSEKQDEIWERLKTASDVIYKRKKEFISNIKESLNENLVKKNELLSEMNKIKSFNSTEIKQWSQKTKYVLSLKDKWNSIGGVPKTSAKNINKDFWNLFKEFFNKKSSFFKKIDESYNNNLELKKDLIKKVDDLKESEDWENTSNQIQKIQLEWRKIGKVPIKFKDSIYDEFKKSCDHFYNRKRLGDKDTIKLYEDNLKLKISICDKITELAKNDSINQDEFFKLQVQYLEVGHIPKENIDELNNLSLKVNINQGEIEFSDSNVIWKDDVRIKLTESLLVFEKNEINLIGKIILDFDNINDFYKSFQINKKYRKDLKQIKINFVYNMNLNEISFDNVKIDGNSDEKIEKNIDNFNLKDKSIFNKITFKNFINNFFNSYSG